jgi:hypothetical protein
MSKLQEIQQEMHNGKKFICPCCGESTRDGRPIHRMMVYGRSEDREVHETCFTKYLQVDNTEILNSTKVRKNGIINRVKLTISSSDISNLKTYMVTSGFTYVRANQYGATFISYQFSGCSSISKWMKNCFTKFSYLQVKNYVIYNVNHNDVEECNITMKYGVNTDYTEAIRLYNANKASKLFALLDEMN